ncbi:MAG: TOBE domain-containing protein, partial [Paracoccaceae bacterium]
ENNTMPCSLMGREAGLAVVKMADGSTLKAVDTGATPSADLTLSVRPENIMLAGDQTPPGMNLFSGTATDVFFLGDHMRLSVEAFGGQTVTARIPIAVARTFAPGETVHLACKAADCRLLEG